MKAKDLIYQAREKFSADFLESVRNGDEGKMADAIAEFSQQLQEAMLQEAADTNGDRAALAARGVRVLTSQEQKYYEKLIEAMKTDGNVKMAISGLNDAMPETIIDAVMEDIQSDFPLLDAIDFRNTTAVTKWFYNKQGTQQAEWGDLGTSITKELSGSIGNMDLTQCKLTAYMVVSKDFLLLGPAWLDRYIRSILSEANGLALEAAVADGDGKSSPIGMSRDLTKGTTTDQKTTYSRKAAVKVKTLDPETYGSILAKLAVTPSGRQRTVREVIMVVNPSDYLTKVMPATTIMTPQGTYISDVLPFPTKVIQSVGVEKGHAIVGLGKRYFVGLGTSKRGFIEYSDYTQFLEDNRVYTTHLYGNGMPLDNNAFVYLDISGLEAPALKVQGISEVQESQA
ncbi:MAG: phage major capsid protein [Roseburia sp.]|nr:phage major capsid protein [Roseburia sp.]MCM1097794.1 phage major capsid protein [Ruminococcus flavefaciens]